MSTGLRRRHGMATNGELKESLLSQEHRLEPDSPHRAPRGLGLTGEASTSSTCCCWLFSYLVTCMSTFWPAPFQMSLLQAEQWEALQAAVMEPFNHDDPVHQDALRELWQYAFNKPCTSLKSPQWTEMGWQGEDPSTDIRGAGMFGLRNLLFLAEHEPSTFQRLMLKTDGVRSDWEYPFAAASINITFMLSQVLGLTQGGAQGATIVSKNPSGSPSGDGGELPAPGTLAGQCFVQICSDEPDKFQQLYVATFELLDRLWLQQKASYMQFNQIMKEVRSRVEAALLSRPATMQVLKSRLCM